MEIRSGAEWQNKSGNKQYYDITLTDADATETLDPDKWAKLTLRRRIVWLTAEADQMVVAQMQRTGALTTEFAQERVKDLRQVQKVALGED